MLIARGPTLTLRPPADADVPSLFAHGRDPEVVRWFSWGPYESEDEPRAFVRESARRAQAGEALVFAIERGGELVGVTELGEHSGRDRRAMVGTWLAPGVWGTGVNAESKAVVLHVAFAVLGLERVGAYTNVANARSQRALDRLGFAREGVLRRWHRHGDVFHDVVMWSVLRDEWGSETPVVVEGEAPASFGR